MLVTELCPALLVAEEERLLLDSLLVEEAGAVEVFDTLNEVREGDEEKPVDGADDVIALDRVGGGNTEPRVEP